jgi:hypothetical protein
MEKPNFILIIDDKIMLFLIEFEIKGILKHLASYVKSDATFLILFRLILTD